jgi:hypothetical protein
MPRFGGCNSQRFSWLISGSERSSFGFLASNPGDNCSASGELAGLQE